MTSAALMGFKTKDLEKEHSLEEKLEFLQFKCRAVRRGVCVDSIFINDVAHSLG